MIKKAYYTKEEAKIILGKYKRILCCLQKKQQLTDVKIIKKAFILVNEAHSNAKRKSGEPYVYHLLDVALIVCEEIGLGTTSVVAALLHDVIEDTSITAQEIESVFGKKIAEIVVGLTKIAKIFDSKQEQILVTQADNFRKILLTLSRDARVILIKIADRLHNMRTIEHMKRENQLKTSSETLYLYAPLANRLSLYAIKNELEDLSLRMIEPENYQQIERKVKKLAKDSDAFIKKFVAPIEKKLKETGINYKLSSRTKSVYSIWNKIKNKHVPFEEIFDLLAVRIVIDPPEDQLEKSICWQVYAVVTENYLPNQSRFRDWITKPKVNGYESLHITVMAGDGKFIEVQIRSKRMDEEAENGLAAHWKYKENADQEDNKIDLWTNRIGLMLKSKETELDSVSFLDEVKLNLQTNEIYVFTPRGEVKNLPKFSTVLDFAFWVHTKIGESTIGAKVNGLLVPLNFQLNNGDRVEVLTDKQQSPKEEWLEYTTTNYAQNCIKNFLKEERKIFADMGREIIKNRFKQQHIHATEYNIKQILKYYNFSSEYDLYYKLATEQLHLDVLHIQPDAQGRIHVSGPAIVLQDEYDIKDHLIVELKPSSSQHKNYFLAKCCLPFPGDEIFGIEKNNNLVIHKTSCAEAIYIYANFAHLVAKARWNISKKVDILVGIKIDGSDKIGVVKNVSKVVSDDLKLNMRSIMFEAKGGIFNGKITCFVKDKKSLEKILAKLQEVDGVVKVTRIE